MPTVVALTYVIVLFLQCQAIVVGFLASWFAILIGLITDGSFNVSHALLLCASSILTAAAASILLGK